MDYSATLTVCPYCGSERPSAPTSGLETPQATYSPEVASALGSEAPSEI